MRRFTLFAALAVAVPFAALGQVSRPAQAAQSGVAFQTQVNGTVSAINYLAIVNPTTRCVQKVTIYQTTASGGGAGSTIARITDGTNNCDATFACSTTTGTNTALTVTPTGSCCFTRGANILMGFSASTCTTTQPGARSLVATGILYLSAS